MPAFDFDEGPSAQDYEEPVDRAYEEAAKAFDRLLELRKRRLTTRVIHKHCSPRDLYRIHQLNTAIMDMIAVTDHMYAATHLMLADGYGPRPVYLYRMFNAVSSNIAVIDSLQHELEEYLQSIKALAASRK